MNMMSELVFLSYVATGAKASVVALLFILVAYIVSRIVLHEKKMP